MAADYKFDDGATPQRERLGDLVDSSAGLKDLSFAWLAPIVSETLEDATLRYFGDHAGPDFPPLPVDPHLAEASRLLDVCLVQRREIFQLEAQAIMSALDICLAGEMNGFDRAIAEVEFSAAVKQSDIPAPGPENPVREKYDLQRQGIQERLRLHNQKGGALNYGERVSFLRQIYMQNLRIAFNRLHAFSRGARFAYRMRMSGPSWNEGGGDLLAYLVTWARDAVDLIEAGASDETIYDILIYLVDHGLSDALKTKLRVSHNDTTPFAGKFTLTPKHFVQDGFKEPLATDAVRIIGVDLAFTYREDLKYWSDLADDIIDRAGGANLVFKDKAMALAMINERIAEFRRSRTLGMRLKPPALVVRGGKGEIDSPMSRETRFGMVPAWIDGPARDQFRPTAGKDLRDVCPFGEWSLEINRRHHGAIGPSNAFPISMVPLASMAFPTLDLGLVDDVVLMLRVAVRPSTFDKP